MLIATPMASQPALHARTGASMEDAPEMAKQMLGLGYKTSTERLKHVRHLLLTFSDG